MNPSNNTLKILIVDDNRSIHDDYLKILRPDDSSTTELRAAEVALFGEVEPERPMLNLEIKSVYQGEEAIAEMESAMKAGLRYSMAFMDVRMPPGLDGIETTARLWKLDPDLQVVLCTAYSDYNWNDVRAKLGDTDNLVILKKPFDNIEVLQLAQAMTEKWRLRQQAHLKMSDLEEGVRQRTAELEKANAQLQTEIGERKQAEAALRHSQELLLRQERLAAVGQLSAGIAHDFNNIMTVIQGHASLLTMSAPLSENSLSSVHEIEAAAVRAANLTRQLLAFSRKQVMQQQPVDPTAVVKNLVSMLERALGETIALRFECPATVPRIMADAGMIEQVLMNLAVNARDAMPNGGDLILRLDTIRLNSADVDSRPEARAGTFVCLTVRDTGCGMDEQTLRRLFEPFFTTKDVGKGTGLGLATAYGIVKQHHGWIEVESRLGAGSAFQVFLPASSLAAAPGPSSRNGSSAIQRGNGETILLVEDEPALRKMVSGMFRRHGYTVIEAGCGREALERWQESKEQVSLLLTDMVMPNGMSGTDLARKVRNDDPTLRIIFTSGYSEELMNRKAEIGGTVHFLPKPYQPSSVLGLVRQSLDQTIDHPVKVAA